MGQRLGRGVMFIVLKHRAREEVWGQQAEWDG